MRRIALARHAKSSWSDQSLSDFNRPLNKRGLRDAPRMGDRLAALKRTPEQVVSSPALRAISTARQYADSLALPEQAIIEDARIYEASLQALAYVVQELPEQARHVLLVGHNPGFSALAHWLAICPFDEMPTSAIAVIELHVDQWSEVGPGCGQLVEYLYPKDGLG